MNTRTTFALLLVLLTLLLAACVPADLPLEGWPTAAERPTAAQPPTLCPQATPELLSVEPVTSPTTDLTQVVTVRLGNAEIVTITAESGVFTAAGFPAWVEVALLPDTIHHLQVVGRVREIVAADGCVYGGYTLRTQRDRNGLPLVIEQGRPALPTLPGTAITSKNVAQLRPLLALAPRARLTTDFVFLGDQELVSVGYSDHISLWDVTTGQEIGRLAGPRGELGSEAAALAVAAGPGGQSIATAGTADDPTVRLWEIAAGVPTVIGRHDDLVQSVTFSPDGTRLASGDNGNRVRIWDLVSGQPPLLLEGDVPGHLQSFTNLYWLDDGSLLAAGSDAIYRWAAASGELLGRLSRPDSAAFLVDVALDPAGDRLAAAAQDDRVYVWDRDTSKWAAWPAPPGSDLSAVEFSPDGRLLASATRAGELLIWEVASGELLATYSVVDGSIAAVRFSPEGRTLAVGGWDSPIWIWAAP